MGEKMNPQFYRFVMSCSPVLRTLISLFLPLFPPHYLKMDLVVVMMTK